MENGLGNKFTGTDNSDVVVGSTGLNFQSGVNKIVFTSGSSLNIWRLANYDYSAFAATLTIEFPAFTGSPVTEQILNNYIALPTSSGIVNDETSISLVVLKSTSAFTFRGKVVTTTGLVNVNVNTVRTFLFYFKYVTLSIVYSPFCKVNIMIIVIDSTYNMSRYNEVVARNPWNR